MTGVARSIAIAAIALLAIAGCGRDDSTSTTGTTASGSSTTTSSTETTGVPAATCSASNLPAGVRSDDALPAPVAAMRADLARAAATCDYARLATLADRGGRSVRFSWGDETDPIAFWRAAEADGEKPAPLRALRLLLDLPATATDAGNGTTQYVWPPAFASEHPADAQLQQIVDTGLYDLATLRRWVDGGSNYLGYRVIGTATGDLTAFVSGD